jgi:hypothetical protein
LRIAPGRTEPPGALSGVTSFLAGTNGLEKLLRALALLRKIRRGGQRSSVGIRHDVLLS